MEEHEHQWVCNDSGENWDDEGTYFERIETCSVKGCNVWVDVKYNRRIIIYHDGEED